MYVSTLGAAYYAMYYSGKYVYDTDQRIVDIIRQDNDRYTVLYEDGTAGTNYSGEYRVIVRTTLKEEVN